MPKVLGIEVGTSKIRICEEDYKTKNPKVYQAFSIDTPSGAVNDGTLNLDEELVAVIKSALTEHKIKTKQIIFTLNSTKIASREIAIPFVKDTKKIKDLIKANASDYFPVDLQQYEIGHTINSVVQNEDGTKQYKLTVLAVPQMIVNSYIQLGQMLGCSVVALDYSGNSIYQVVRRQCDAGIQMVVNVDENSSMITILQDQAIVLQRTVAYGAEDAVTAVSHMREFDRPKYDEAIRILREQDCMDREPVAQSLGYLISGISRVVDYFVRTNNLTIEQGYLTGFGGTFQGLAGIISQALEVPTEPLTEIKGLHLDKYFKEEGFGEYLNCIGAVIAPIGFMPEKEKGKGSMSVLPNAEDMFKVTILAAVACVIGSVALIAVSYLHFRTATMENTRLQNRIVELADAETIYQEYLQQLYTYQKLTYFQASTVTYNESLVDFIEEMEEKMPASLNVQSFAAGPESVTMSMTVADKREAAKVIQQFRSFDTVESVDVSSMNDSGAVMDGDVLEEEPKVGFSITVRYKGRGVIEPAPAPTTAPASSDSDDDILE